MESLFPIISVLETEIGGFISHGAVVAREYGIPCLIAVNGACRMFKTGDICLLNTEISEIIKVQWLLRILLYYNHLNFVIRIIFKYFCQNYKIKKNSLIN